MKNTKTTLMELTKQYRSVLMKCTLLNMVLLVSIPSIAATIDFTEDVENVSYKGITATGFTIDNKTLSIKESEIIGNIGDNFDIQDSTVTITDSDLETKGNLTISGSTLSFSCQGEDCEPEEDGPGIGFLATNATITNSSITMGEKGNDDDYAYIGANGEFSINGNSSITLNSNSTLAYEGDEENGDGLFEIEKSTLVLNDNSSLNIGEDDNTSNAPLKISESHITLNDNSKIQFQGNNNSDTTITGSTIVMNDKSSLKLNDLYISNSTFTMKEKSSVDLNNLTLDGVTIRSHLLSVLYFNGWVKFKGLLDPATAEVNGDLTRSGYDDEITYNLNANGTLIYSDDSFLYDTAKHTHGIGEVRQSDNTFPDGKYALNTINFKGGALDLKNGAATAIHLASLSLADGTTSSIYADVDLANKKMDILTADNISVGSGAQLNIAGLNLISDATNEKTSIIFTDNENLKTATTYTGETTGLKALSPVYTYDVAYNDGIFEFTRLGSGENSNDYNPAVYSSTTVSQNVGLLSSNINSIAFAGLSGENSSPQGRSGGDLPAMGNTWVKLVGFDENVDFDLFQTIDSQVFSVIGGMTTDKLNLGSSDMTFGAYAGYLNGKQKYTGNKVEQNGGYFGLSTSWTKDRIFVDGTINAGFIRNEAKHSFGTDKYNTYWTGAAAKVGYNYALTDTLTFVPSFYTGYTMVATKDYTSVSGVRIENDKTHIFEFAPGLKLSQQFNNDWTGFIQGKYAILKNHGGDVTADDIALPNISTDNYAEYGIGLDKVLTDSWTLSLTANRRDGGRQGWNGSVEFKYNF